MKRAWGFGGCNIANLFDTPRTRSCTNVYGLRHASASVFVQFGRRKPVLNYLVFVVNVGMPPSTPDEGD
jgi:hypothetical protein